MFMEMETLLSDESPDLSQDREVVFTSHALSLRDGFVEEDPPVFEESHVHDFQSSWPKPAFLWAQ